MEAKAIASQAITSILRQDSGLWLLTLLLHQCPFGSVCWTRRAVLEMWVVRSLCRWAVCCLPALTESSPELCTAATGAWGAEGPG